MNDHEAQDRRAVESPAIRRRISTHLAAVAAAVGGLIPAMASAQATVTQTTYLRAPATAVATGPSTASVDINRVGPHPKPGSQVVAVTAPVTAVATPLTDVRIRIGVR